MSSQEPLPEGFEDEKEEVYPEPTQEDLKKMDRIYSKKKEMWWNIIVYSLAGIALFGAIGYGLDLWLGTDPILLIVLIIISFPFTQFALYKRIQKMVKD